MFCPESSQIPVEMNGHHAGGEGAVIRLTPAVGARGGRMRGLRKMDDSGATRMVANRA